MDFRVLLVYFDRQDSTVLFISSEQAIEDSQHSDVVDSVLIDDLHRWMLGNSPIAKDPVLHQGYYGAWVLFQ